MSMRAAVYEHPGKLTLESLPLPALQPGDLLLKVRAASICATDLKIVAHGHFKIPEGTRRVLGHELAGEVVVPSPDAPDLSVGTRVGVAPNIGCGRCEMCVQGQDHLCPRYEALGITMDGGLAEYVRVPAAAVHRGHVVAFPPRLGDAEAALVEPMSCVVNAHEAVGTGWRDHVLIFGAGPMGLLHILLTQVIGASRIVAVEPDPHRQQQARTFGVDAVVSPSEVMGAVEQFTGGRGFDVVVVAVPAREALEQAPLVTSTRGRINVFAGLPAGATLPAIDTNAVHYRQLILTGTTGASVAQYRRTVALAGSGRLNLTPLISLRVPLESVEDAFRRARDRDVLKVVVHPHAERSAGMKREA